MACVHVGVKAQLIGVLCSHYVSPGNQTQGIGLGGKSLDLLSCLASLRKLNINRD